MKLLDNITWLNAMELFDKQHSVTNDVETTNDIIKNMEKIPEDKRSEIRKVKALEIIAEELIKRNETSGGIVTALENIDIEFVKKVNEWWDSLSDDKQWKYIDRNMGRSIRFYRDLPFPYQSYLYKKCKKGR